MNTQKHRSFRTLILAVSIEPQEIGKRIASARNRKGWTQMDLAQKASVSMSTVQRWERGDLPPVRELIRLAGVLEVDPEQLVELEPTDQSQLAALVEAVAGLREDLHEVREIVAELRGGSPQASPVASPRR